MPPLDPEPNEEEDKEKLDNDFDPPFSLPDDSHAVQAGDPQALDQNLEDQQELYDEGLKGADDSSNGEGLNPNEEGFDNEPNEDEV